MALFLKHVYNEPLNNTENKNKIGSDTKFIKYNKKICKNIQ